MAFSKSNVVVVLALASAVGCAGDEKVTQTYEPGAGLELSGTTFSVSQTQVESWAKNVCFDDPAELSAFAPAEHDHDGVYEPKLGRVVVVHVVPADPAASGTALLDAVAGITDAAYGASVLVLLEPGTYDLGESTLSLPEYVDLAGLAKDSTLVTSQSPSGTVVVSGSNYASTTLHELTIENHGGGTQPLSVALVLDGTIWVHLRGLRVSAFDGAETTYGLWAKNSALLAKVNDLDVNARSAAGTSIGLFCDDCSGSSRVSKAAVTSGATADGVTVAGMEVSTMGTTGLRGATGLRLVDFSVVTVTHSFAPASVVGIRVTAGHLELLSSQVTAFGGTAVSVPSGATVVIRGSELTGDTGVSAESGSSAFVLGSQISAVTNAVSATASTAKVANTELAEGAVSTGVTCYAVTRDFANAGGVNSCP